MDTKAAARSKRASSLRGRTKHASHRHHGAAASAPRNKNHEDQQLPSNWLRYGEDDSESESVNANANAEDSVSVSSSDAPPPRKSKGADYLELLSQEQSLPYSYPPELKTGMSSLIQLRGQNLLVWGLEDDHASTDGDDDTIIDEASILSLDLAFLERKLAQFRIADRLMIDPDILPGDEVERRLLLVSKIKPTVDIKNEAAHSQMSCYPGMESRESDEAAGQKTSSSLNENKNFELGSNFMRVTGEKRQPFSFDGKFVLEESNASKIHYDLSFTGAKSEQENITNKHSLDGIIGQQDMIGDLKEVETKAEKLQQVASRDFKPESAEAELDALLDMLDKNEFETSSSIISSYPPKREGNNPRQDSSIHHGFFTTGSSSFSSNAIGVPANTATEAQKQAVKSEPILGKPMDHMFNWDNKKASLKPLDVKSHIVLGKATNHMSTLDNKKGSIKPLDDDLDDWLDSL